MSRTIESIESSIRALKNFIPEGGNVLAAVSGGPDSMALLHALYTYQKHLRLNNIAVVHYDHGLRPESSAEAEYVHQYAKSLNIICYIGKSAKGSLYDSNHGSMQETARVARYRFIESIADTYGADWIATAHHQDDQIETVIINIFRGTGIDGLRGIPSQRDKYIRPFLNVSRALIEDYCIVHNLNPRRDRSNDDPSHYLRNKIRLKLLPELESEYHPGVKKAILRLSRNANIDSDYLQQMALCAFDEAMNKTQSDKISLDIGRLLKNHLAMQRRVLRIAIQKIRGHCEGVTEEHIETALAFCNENIPPYSITLPNSLIHITRRDLELVIEKPSKNSTPTFDIDINELPLNTAFLLPNGWEIMINYDNDAVPVKSRPSLQDREFTAVIDLDRVEMSQMHIRNWLPGDRIDPLGMNGKMKKAQDLFVNAKLPISKRAEWPIVADNTGVIWLPGIALSERVRIEQNSTKRLKLLLLLPALLNSVDLVEP